VSHKFKTKQTVALAHGQREVYEIVRLMPETFSGEPQYRIKNVTTATERVVRETEIRAL